MLQRPLNRNGSFPHPGDYDNDVEDKADGRNDVNDDDDDVEDKVDGRNDVNDDDYETYEKITSRHPEFESRSIPRGEMLLLWQLHVLHTMTVN